MAGLRAFVCVFSDRLPEVRDFYVSLFGWRVDFDSDWFVHLHAEGDAAIELGVLRRDHEIVPAAFRAAPAGVMVTIVVPDVDDVHRAALAAGHPVVEEPRDLFYGQRRMLLRDPSGTLLDVSSECTPSAEFLASLQDT
jgi:catechol 2,3-dioxygenase-like lactoylglutathione lyase family enzyme